MAWSSTAAVSPMPTPVRSKAATAATVASAYLTSGVSAVTEATASSLPAAAAHSSIPALSPEATAALRAPALSNGLAGLGGVGIVGTNLSIVNSGSITGGLGGNGSTRANAISFTGGSNVLELRAGSTITGNVVGTNSDTLRLGGTADSTFDVSARTSLRSQYTGFSTFVKTGSSTWTLTGTTLAFTPWTIDQGTLAVSSDSNLGNVLTGEAYFQRWRAAIPGRI